MAVGTFGSMLGQQAGGMQPPMMNPFTTMNPMQMPTGGQMPTGINPGITAAQNVQGHGANAIPAPFDQFGFFRKNNSPLQDISQAMALGRPITDAQWAQAGYGPGGSGGPGMQGAQGMQGPQLNTPQMGGGQPMGQMTGQAPGAMGGGGQPDLQSIVNAIQAMHSNGGRPGGQGFDWSSIGGALGMGGGQHPNVTPNAGGGISPNAMQGLGGLLGQVGPTMGQPGGMMGGLGQSLMSLLK